MYDAVRWATPPRIITDPLNCLDVATPVLRERCERELGIPREGLALLAAHNHRGPIQIVREDFDYGRELATRERASDLHQSQAPRVKYTRPVGWSLDVEDECSGRRWR